MRLLYSCSELGLGHASRTIALGKKLKEKGHEVFFFTGARAYELLRQEFRNVYPSTPVAWYENAHGIITSASLINILVPLPVFNNEKGKFEIKNSSAMETTHRYYDLRKQIKQIKPDLIVSDGDIHALRLANRWHFPSVYITNLIRPSYGFSPFLNPGERLTERYVKECSKIIIPDNPPPFTISEYNIGNLGNIGIRGTNFVARYDPKTQAVTIWTNSGLVTYTPNTTRKPTDVLAGRVATFTRDGRASVRLLSAAEWKKLVASL